MKFTIGIMPAMGLDTQGNSVQIQQQRLEGINGYPAFSIFEHEFWVHREYNASTWTISHYKTGAAINVTESTMKKAIKEGQAHIERQGAKRLEYALNHARISNKKYFGKEEINP